MNKRILVLMFLLLFLPLVGCFPGPTNQTPILTSDPVTTATVGIKYVYDVNATDPDGDTLTYSLLTTYPSNMTINSATGVISWIPTLAQVGNNPVIVKVSDGSLSITQSFTIKVSTLPPANQAPVITPIPSLTAIVGVAFTYDVNATDPDGDTLTYSLTTYYHSGMGINPTNGLIWWTPTAKGNYVVVVEVSDGVLSDTQGFTITVSELPVVNQAPVITTTTLPNATVGTAYTAAVVATDADGDVLTFSLVSELTGMVISGAGVISGWTPTEAGTEDVTVTVTDGKDSVSEDFTITVLEPVPEYSTYAFWYVVPDEIVAGNEYIIPVIFLSTEVKELGYDDVRFKFSTSGPPDSKVIFSATYPGGVYTADNYGFWGPEIGFEIPADYLATTDWTLTFSLPGEYTITFSLIEAPNGDVVDGITGFQEITVVAAAAP